jgi:hypothetical protein
MNIKMEKQTHLNPRITSEASLTDKWLKFFLLILTGHHAFVEFSEEIPEKRKISKLHRFYRRQLLRPIKQVLRFIVFGIEDALNERKKNKMESEKINDHENRYKTDYKQK